MNIKRIFTYIAHERLFELRLENGEGKFYTLESFSNLYNALVATHKLRDFAGEFTFGSNLIDIKFNPDEEFVYSFKRQVDAAINALYEDYQK